MGIHPIGNINGNGVHFKTFRPEIFKDLIDCIWIMEYCDNTAAIITPPNQYVNITFSVGAPYYRGNQKISTPQIEGLNLRSTSFTHLNGNKLIGIRFLPFGLYAFLKDDHTSFINETIDLRSIFGELAVDTENKLTTAANDTEAINIINAFLARHFIRKKYNKLSLVKDGYHYFHSNKEANAVDGFIKGNYSNYTSLNRQFTEMIGVSPKKIERLLKFRKSLCSLIHSKSSLTDIGLEAGYFDQSHFIREFASFLNCTPKSYSALLHSKLERTNKISFYFSVL